MTKWDPSPEFLSQSGHFLFGLSATALPGWIWGTTAAAYGSIGIGIYALLKEIVWDPITETENPFFWVGVKDCVFFALGIGTAWGMHLIF